MTFCSNPELKLTFPAEDEAGVAPPPPPPYSSGANKINQGFFQQVSKQLAVGFKEVGNAIQVLVLRLHEKASQEPHTTRTTHAGTYFAAPIYLISGYAIDLPHFSEGRKCCHFKCLDASYK